MKKHDTVLDPGLTREAILALISQFPVEDLNSDDVWYISSRKKEFGSIIKTAVEEFLSIKIAKIQLHNMRGTSVSFLPIAHSIDDNNIETYFGVTNKNIALVSLKNFFKSYYPLMKKINFSDYYCSTKYFVQLEKSVDENKQIPITDIDDVKLISFNNPTRTDQIKEKVSSISGVISCPDEFFFFLMSYNLLIPKIQHTGIPLLGKNIVCLGKDGCHDTFIYSCSSPPRLYIIRSSSCENFLWESEKFWFLLH